MIAHQTEAQRLAEQCEGIGESDGWPQLLEAAAELRRLDQSEREGWRYADELEQERKRLNALNAELVEALKYCRQKIAYMTTHGEWYSPGSAIEKADAALAKAEGK